jgi:Polyketide cyclase / dehydrase and lipid transport
MRSSVSVSRDITASPDAAWALLSDLPSMGKWSPENEGGEWINGASGPAVGAAFRGNNSNGTKTWTTLAKVTQCEPGRSFGFDVAVGPFKVANWHYSVEALGDGRTRVTERWTDQRLGLIRMLGKPFSGVADRATYNRAGMEVTLEKMASALEAAN